MELYSFTGCEKFVFGSDNIYFSSTLGRTALFRILKGLSLESPDVGYVQGHNFIAGYVGLGIFCIMFACIVPLLLHRLCLLAVVSQHCPHLLDKKTYGLDAGNEPDDNLLHNSAEIDPGNELHLKAEEEAFWLSLALLRAGDEELQMKVTSAQNDMLISFFAPGLARLQTSAALLGFCISSIYPEVHDRMKELHVEPLLFCCPYFLTLFTYNLPTTIALQMWDCFILSHAIPEHDEKIRDRKGFVCRDGVRIVSASSFERFVINVILAYIGEWKDLIKTSESSEGILKLFRHLRFNTAAACAQLLQKAQQMDAEVLFFIFSLYAVSHFLLPLIAFRCKF